MKANLQVLNTKNSISSILIWLQMTKFGPEINNNTIKTKLQNIEIKFVFCQF